MEATQLIQHFIEAAFRDGDRISAEIESSARDELRGSRHFSVTWENYLVEITAWDRAYCLDIMAYDSENESEDYAWAEAGACFTEKEFRARFDRFETWFRTRTTQ